MPECQTKLGPGWRVQCGKPATAIVVYESPTGPVAVAACAEHAPASESEVCEVPDLSALSDVELRGWCEERGLSPSF
jgi:hypothetical protein